MAQKKNLISIVVATGSTFTFQTICLTLNDFNNRHIDVLLKTVCYYSMYCKRKGLLSFYSAKVLYLFQEPRLFQCGFGRK